MGTEDQKLFAYITTAFLGIHVFGYSLLPLFCPESGDLPYYCQPEEIRFRPIDNSGTTTITSSTATLSSVGTTTTI